MSTPLRSSDRPTGRRMLGLAATIAVIGTFQKLKTTATSGVSATDVVMAKVKTIR